MEGSGSLKDGLGHSTGHGYSEYVKNCSHQDFLEEVVEVSSGSLSKVLE